MNNNWLQKLQNTLLPPRCLLCHAYSDTELDLCSSCYQDLPFQQRSCIRCALPIAAYERVCGSCQNLSPAYSRCISVFNYSPPLDFMIQQLKYFNKLPYAYLLGTLMSHTLKLDETATPELIIPIPLHPKRVAERGFNQALELARPISRLLDIPIDYRSCQRLRHTPKQAGLSARQRRENLTEVFTITENIEASHIALLDDVMTTGTTVELLAKELIDNGAGRVDVWVCARAVI